VRNRDRVGSRWANMTQSDAIVWVLFGVFLFLVSLFGSNLVRPMGYGPGTGKEIPMWSGRLFVGLVGAGFLAAALKHLIFGR